MPQLMQSRTAQGPGLLWVGNLGLVGGGLTAGYQWFCCIWLSPVAALIFAGTGLGRVKVLPLNMPNILPLLGNINRYEAVT